MTEKENGAAPSQSGLQDGVLNVSGDCLINNYMGARANKDLPPELRREKKVSSLYRTIRLTDPRTKALAVLFDVTPSVIEKMFRGKLCALNIYEISEKPAVSHRKKIMLDYPRRAQPIPGENSTKKLYHCVGGCGRSRWLTEGEARRKGYVYSCPRCAQTKGIGRV